MKNSGDGGPVGTLSEIASVRGWAGCISGCVVGFDFPIGISEMLAPKYLIGCLNGEISELGSGAPGCTLCHVGGACAIIGAAAGVEFAGAAFDHGQMLDVVAGCAAGAGRRDIAMEAGSARTVVAVKPSALTATEIDLRQAVCMAVLLDVVDRRHPCRRLINSK
jgi:hypothetical protein